MQTLTGFKVRYYVDKENETDCYHIILVIRPEPDGWLERFCKRATTDYIDSSVITDLEAHHKAINDFKGGKFTEVRKGWQTFSEEYWTVLDSYVVCGKSRNWDNYCLSYLPKHNCYVFREYFKNNASADDGIAELQAMYENQDEIKENELTRLLQTLNIHWD